MFIPSANRIEIRPFSKDSLIANDKQELVELGEVVSVGEDEDHAAYANVSTTYPIKESFYKVGDILAFEGWGCTKISYKGEDKWVVSTDKNVILGKFTRDGEK